LEQLDARIDKARKDEDFLATLTREKDLVLIGSLNFTCSSPVLMS
jgi:hypothetical protein